MADLNSIIRLHKHELDEKQREIGLLYEQMNALHERRKHLQDQRADEVQAASENPETVTFTLSGFLERSKAEEETITAKMFELNDAVEALRDEMIDSFAELKKYELTQNERDRLADKERKLKEGRMFDDIAIQGFRRGQDE